MGQYGPFAADLTDTSQQAAAAANPTSNFGPFSTDLEPTSLVGEIGAALSARVAQAKKEFAPQPGESLLGTVGRDYLDIQKRVGEGALSLGEGLAKPFKTVALGGLGDFLKPGDPITAPTVGQTALAGVQAATEVLAGPAEGRLADLMGGGLAARVGARAATGAGAGAIFNPTNPGIGALAGGVIGVGVGGTLGKGAASAVAPVEAVAATDAAAAPE